MRKDRNKITRNITRAIDHCLKLKARLLNTKVKLLEEEISRLVGYVEQCDNTDLSNLAYEILLISFNNDIKKMSNEYFTCRCDKIKIDEYMEIGRCALNVCCSEYDPDKGRFKSHLKTVMKRLMDAEIRFKNNNISPYYAERVRKIRTKKDTFIKEHGREPNIEELADALETSVETLGDWLLEGQRENTLSLDEITEDADRENGPDSTALDRLDSSLIVPGPEEMIDDLM